MKKTIVLATILCLIAIVGCKKDHYYYIDVRSDNAACSVTGSGTYQEGSSIVISAQPANGYIFKKWNDGNTQDTRYISVWGDATYIAYFESQNSNISAPTGVTASIYEDEDGVFVYVKWNNVSNAVKYNIYYSTSSSGSYSNIGSVTSNYCYITNPNTYNYVKVTAVNSNGAESDMSNYAYCYYNGGGGGGGTTVPNAPTGVTATNVGSSSSPQIEISWNSVSNATSYKVYRSSSASGTYSLLGSTSSTYKYDNNPMSGYNYYKVKAVNSAGESSYSSYAYYNNTGGGGGGTTVPNAPTGVTATNVGSSSSPQIEISWNSVSNATSYKVYRSSSASGTYSLLGSTSSTYKYDNNPMSGYNYYKVKAVNSAGESSYSSYAYYNNTGGGGGGSSYDPCPPTVSVSGTSSQTVSWTVSTSSGCGTPTSFEVYKYAPCTSTWELKTTTSSHSYSCPSSNVHPGINRYAVKAINSNGNAVNYGFSSSVSLAKPSSFSVQKAGDNLYFEWSMVPKATGYQIYICTTASGTYTIFDQITDVNTEALIAYYPASSGSTRYFKIRAYYDCGGSTIGGPIYSDFTTYKVVHF